MNEATGVEPFAPFQIPVVTVDQITGMQQEIDPWHGGIGLADHTGPHGFQLILGVPKIDEAERFIRRASGIELEPF